MVLLQRKRSSIGDGALRFSAYGECLFNADRSGDRSGSAFVNGAGESCNDFTANFSFSLANDGSAGNNNSMKDAAMILAGVPTVAAVKIMNG